MVSEEALKKLQEKIAAWPMTQRFVVQQLIEDYRRNREDLRAYKATGLTPERCAEFARADAEGRYIVMRDAEQEGVARLRELAEANKNGRLAVLPRKTRQTELLKMFPEAHVSANGSLYLCPASVSAAYRDENGNCKVRRIKCADCRKEFWGREVE